MNPLLELVITVAKEVLLPLLGVLFVMGITLRGLIQFTIKREQWFVGEFEKRAVRHIYYENPQGSHSFIATLKKLLERTFYELFEMRSIMKRRRLDHIMAPADRLFLIQQGAACLVRDTMRFAGTLRKDEQKEEKDELLNVSKLALQENACFSRIFGIVPIGPVNDFLNQLPGLFIVLGIFGTFLGIMKALPELGGMDPADAVGSKIIMDEFLMKIAFSMSTSATGIFLSVVMQIFNSFFNPEKLFIRVVSQYEEALHQLWRNCETNELPKGLPAFDENRDPKEALAELALQKELASKKTKKEDRQHAGPPSEDQNSDKKGAA